MQRHTILTPRISILASFGARAGALSSAAIWLLLASACSNASPNGKQQPGSDESVHSDIAESTRVVGYLPNYRGPLSDWTQRLDFSAFTHINLAFGDVESGTDGLEIHYRRDGATADEPGLSDFVKKAHDHFAKVCLSIGGSKKSADLGKMIADAPHELAERLASYAQDHALDCIDVDQEEEGHSEALDTAYGEFIRDLGSRLHGAQKQLTAAVAKWNNKKVLPVMAQFDFLNVMAYEYGGPRNSQTPVQASSMADTQGELDDWVRNGAPPDKLVLGMPFYGFKWSAKPESKGADFTIQQIVDDVGSVPEGDETVTKDGSQVTLNGIATIRSKANLGKTSYGGVMIWELGQDASKEHSLVPVIKDIMR